MRGIFRKLMHTCGSFFSRLSYRNRLALAFMAVAMIPIVLVSLINLRISNSQLEEMTEHSFLQTLNQMEINIEKRLQQLDQVLNAVIGDQNIRRALINRTDETDQAEFMEIHAFLSSLKENFDLYGIRIFTDKRGGEGSHFYDKSRLREMPGLSEDELPEDWGRLRWKSTYSYTYAGNDTRAVFSGVRVVKSFNNGSYSICFADVLEEEFYDVIENVSGQDGINTVIIDTSGHVVSGADKGLLGKRYPQPYLEELLNSPEGSFKFENHIIISKRVVSSDLILVSDIPLALIKNKNGLMRSITTAIAFGAGMCALLLSMLMSGGLSRKLGILIRTMRGSAGQELLKEVAPPGGLNENDEIDQLILAYNSMASTITRLIEEVYQTRALEAEYRFKLLQAQINPHFLYNILESIKSFVAGGKTEQAITLIISLSQFYRLLLSKGKDKISIREELDMVRLYVKMQKISYGDDMECAVEVDEEIYPYQIVKFTLQPVIENAIKHGLRNKEGRGSIVVRGRFEKGDIVLEVGDNGAGIEHSRLAELQAGFDNGTESSKDGFGLYNVNERLRFEGPAYGIRISSAEGVGTVVKLTIPKRLGRETNFPL